MFESSRLNLGSFCLFDAVIAYDFICCCRVRSRTPKPPLLSQMKRYWHSPYRQTADIDDTELKREAARQGRTMLELVESALRLLLRSHREEAKLVPLPTFHSGGAVVDIADALYQAGR